MNEIEIALEYAKQKKTTRSHKNNISRRNARLKCNSILDSNRTNAIDPCIITNFHSMAIHMFNNNNMNQYDPLSCSLPADNLNDSVEENADEVLITPHSFDFSSRMHHHVKETLTLHKYTTMDRLLYSKNLIEFIRNANISKSSVAQLITLIQSGLPHPNTLPNNYAEILKLISG